MLDSMAERYKTRPSQLEGVRWHGIDALAFDTGVYLWAAGERALDDVWRQQLEHLKNAPEH